MTAGRNISSGIVGLDAWLDAIHRALPVLFTWTPEFTFATPGDLSIAYSIQAGFGVKIGQFVMVQGNLETSTFTHTTASGNARITGLPYPALSTSNSATSGSVDWEGITHASFTQVNTALLAGNSFLNLRGMASATSRALLTATSFPSGGTVRLIFTHTYYTAQ